VHEPGDPQKLNPGVAPDLAAVVLQALEKDPDRRYSTAGELAGDLRAFLEYRPVTARRISAAARVVRWSRRHRAIAMTILGSAAILLAGGTWFTLSLHAKNLELTGARDEAQDNARRAEASAREASAQAMLAREKQGEAEKNLADFTRMADIRRLADLKKQADELWPAVAANVPAMESWLGRAKWLAGRLETHKVTLAALRERVFPCTEEEWRNDIRTHPEGRELAELLKDKRSKERRVRILGNQDAADAEDEIEQLENEIVLLTNRINRMELRVGERRWNLGTTEERWQNEVLTELVADLEFFLHPVPGPGYGTVADVRGRMAFARSVKKKTIDDRQVDWERAIRSIADPKECPAYKGLRIKPQLGLIPIGRDPASGFWEFVHLQTGEVPDRDPDTGKLKISGKTGLVFVLLPGGEVLLGAERPTSEKPLGTPNIDPYAESNEKPVHLLRLSPFFMSKHEMTQGQWLKITYRNPSFAHEYPRSADSALDPMKRPVENVTWEKCSRVLQNLGLMLPTEAQWEYAARGGSGTVWWTGNRKESLRGAANLADRTSEESIPSYSRSNIWLNDGFVGHAPVDHFAPNPFGLHNVIGNVAEWCRDGYFLYADGAGARSGDGLRQGQSLARIVRGGGPFSPAGAARSATRTRYPHHLGHAGIGVRPARTLAD